MVRTATNKRAPSARAAAPPAASSSSSASSSSAESSSSASTSEASDADETQVVRRRAASALASGLVKGGPLEQGFQNVGDLPLLKDLAKKFVAAEDIGDGTDLVLLSVPVDFDAALLKGKTLALPADTSGGVGAVVLTLDKPQQQQQQQQQQATLTKQQQARHAHQLNVDGRMEVRVAGTAEFQRWVPLFPSRANGAAWKAPKPLARALSVTRAVTLPNEADAARVLHAQHLLPLKTAPQQPELSWQYVPFGAGADAVLADAANNNNSSSSSKRPHGDGETATKKKQDKKQKKQKN